jgi:RNAse (barnase) inhibitor barstar
MSFYATTLRLRLKRLPFCIKNTRGIELLFKKMKQNFQLHFFYGENVNAIYTQVCCTLIAKLLLSVIQKMAMTKKAFSVAASLIRIHLISLIDVFELLRSTKPYFSMKDHPPNQMVRLEFNLKWG